jgi:hypothetical protein
MKKVILKFSAVILIGFAIIAPLQLDAQNKNTDKSAKQGDYSFEKGQTLNKSYIDKVLSKKMALLEHYLTVLIEKKEPNYINAIGKAMQLFNNDETKLITITNKNTGKIYVKPVKEYLTDVSRLPYVNVDITYRNYTAIEQIRKQPDGTFRGVAVFEQEFTGFDKEGKALYHDVIQRNTEVILRIREYPKDEMRHLVKVDIFFGNLGVTEM